MPVLFKRKQDLQKAPDPGTTLLNRILMIGLLFFLGMSILNEKRTLETSLLIWEADAHNSILKSSEKIQVTEGNPVVFKINEADIDKIRQLPKDEKGNIIVFSLNINQVLKKQEEQPKTEDKAVSGTKASEETAKQDKKDLPAQPAPDNKVQPEAAKPNVTP